MEHDHTAQSVIAGNAAAAVAAVEGALPPSSQNRRRGAAQSQHDLKTVQRGQDPSGAADHRQ